MVKIYKITNIRTNKLYIGKTSNSLESRFNKHKHCAKKKINRYLYDSMNFHGCESFKIELIEITSIDKANEREIFWITELNTYIPNGYNMTKGGDGGNTLAAWAEDRKKELYNRQGNSRRGPRNESWKSSLSKSAKLREANKTEEQKNLISDKISSTRKEKIKNGQIVTKMPPLKFGSNNHNYVHIDIDYCIKLITHQWKLKDIAEIYKTKGATISAKLKSASGKNFTEWRNFYGISGSFGKMQRINFD